MISLSDPMPSSTPTLGFLLHDVARFLRKRFEQHARGLGLTRSGWQVLAFLAPNEGIHQAGLADILDLEAITLARILDKLEACNLVERRPHPTDRRVWLLYLTEQAHPMLAQMRVLGDRTRAEALQGIPDAARELLMQSLATMKQNLVLACDQPVQELGTASMLPNEAISKEASNV
jgi:MarR family transcriptional regulator for hemolysin